MSKIIIEREKCIGCGNCAAVCPKYFNIIDDGKSSIIGGEIDPKTNNDELEVPSLECAQAAADSCPVQCIHVS